MQQLQTRRRGSSTGSASSTSLATLAREARALGYVRPGEHLFIVKGINAVAEARAGQHDGPPWTLTPTARSSRARSAASRARSAASPSAARSAGPAVTEQSPYDPDGEPFPTTYYVTCRHLVAAISRLEAAGGVERWTRARRTTTRSSPRAARGPTTSSARIRRELAAGETGRDGGASLELGVGGAGRTGSLKCLHAHAAFALARPGLRARRAHRRRARSAVAGPLLHRPWLASAPDVRRRDDARPAGVGGGRPPARGRARRPRAATSACSSRSRS